MVPVYINRIATAVPTHDVHRKFLDYAFPPLHQPMDVITNTGGRTGWHNSPLPGPLFPSAPQN